MPTSPRACDYQNAASCALGGRVETGQFEASVVRYPSKQPPILIRTRVVTSEISQIRYHSRIAPPSRDMDVSLLDNAGLLRTVT
jgi:hypothetical protein